MVSLSCLVFVMSWAKVRNENDSVPRLTPFSAEVCSPSVEAHVCLFGLCWLYQFIHCLPLVCIYRCQWGNHRPALCVVSLSWHIFSLGGGCLRYDSLCGCWRWIYKLGARLFVYQFFAPEIFGVYFIGCLAFFNEGFGSLWFIRSCWHGEFPRDKKFAMCSILVLDLDTNIARKRSTIDSFRWHEKFHTL